jgi:hypothetical protein
LVFGPEAPLNRYLGFCLNLFSVPDDAGHPLASIDNLKLCADKIIRTRQSAAPRMTAAPQLSCRLLALRLNAVRTPTDAIHKTWVNRVDACSTQVRFRPQSCHQSGHTIRSRWANRDRSGYLPKRSFASLELGRAAPKTVQGLDISSAFTPK